MSMIRVKNLTFGYEGSYENVFENVNFQMDTDWKLGFTGRNGRGKTTFLKLLTGQMQYSGSIDASVDFEYFPYSVQNPEDFAVDVIREIAPAAEAISSKEQSLTSRSRITRFCCSGSLPMSRRTWFTSSRCSTSRAMLVSVGRFSSSGGRPSSSG